MTKNGIHTEKNILSTLGILQVLFSSTSLGIVWLGVVGRAAVLGVHAAHVVLQQELAREGHRADLARERTLAGVKDHVALQVRRPAEPAVAVAANVLASFVFHHVNLFAVFVFALLWGDTIIVNKSSLCYVIFHSNGAES